jgi:hypothetical protein
MLAAHLHKQPASQPASHCTVCANDSFSIPPGVDPRSHACSPSGFVPALLPGEFPSVGVSAFGDAQTSGDPALGDPPAASCSRADRLKCAHSALGSTITVFQQSTGVLSSLYHLLHTKGRVLRNQMKELQCSWVGVARWLKSPARWENRTARTSSGAASMGASPASSVCGILATGVLTEGNP